MERRDFMTNFLKIQALSAQRRAALEAGDARLAEELVRQENDLRWRTKMYEQSPDEAEMTNGR